MATAMYVNPKTAGVGYLTDTTVWSVIAGVLAGAATSKATLRAYPGVFGLADTAMALQRAQVMNRAALAAGVAAVGIGLSTMGGLARPVGLGVYVLGITHLAGRAIQLLGWDVI